MTTVGQGHCDTLLVSSLKNDQDLDYSQLGLTNHMFPLLISFPLTEKLWLKRFACSDPR